MGESFQQNGRNYLKNTQKWVVEKWWVVLGSLQDISWFMQTTEQFVQPIQQALQRIQGFVQVT